MCCPSNLAKTRKRSAICAKLIHFLVPLRTMSVPSAVAVVPTAAASLPTSGSVRAKAASVRPG